VNERPEYGTFVYTLRGQRGQETKGPVVPPHVPEPAHALVAEPAVQLDHEGIAQIGDVAAEGVAAVVLPVGPRQAVRTLDVTEVAELQRRLDARRDVAEQVLEQPAVVGSTTALKGAPQLPDGRPSGLHRLGHPADGLTGRAVVAEVQHRVLDGDAGW
jgi:hypothetical protein